MSIILYLDNFSAVEICVGRAYAFESSCIVEFLLFWPSLHFIFATN
jgi:hypothetical protein